MIRFIKGDIFESDAQVLTNPVNCVGVMGAGLALEFKKRYPRMFADYKTSCRLKMLKIGSLVLWEDKDIKILNFPTKYHWEEKSRLEYIEKGLKSIRDSHSVYNVESIAMPMLGCGLGGLNQDEVKSIMIKYLEDITDLDAVVYI